MKKKPQKPVHNEAFLRERRAIRERRRKGATRNIKKDPKIYIETKLVTTKN